jgi:hypothetical protein
MTGGHGITCGNPPCPFFAPAEVENGDGECRHRSPRAHRVRYDANCYISVWPPVISTEMFCGFHPALAALVRRGGEVLEDDNDPA